MLPTARCEARVVVDAVCQRCLEPMETPVEARVDLLLVEDAGRIVNPMTLKGQAIGGIIQGLGGAFLEHIIYDDNAQVVSGTLAEYLVPSAPDFPNIRAIMLEEKPSPRGRFHNNGGPSSCHRSAKPSDGAVKSPFGPPH